MAKSRASSEVVPPREPELERRFGEWAGRVRRRLTLRSALVGLAIGATAGVLGTALAYFQRWGEARPYVALALAAAGLLAGLVQARHRRLGDAELSLYLDARLGSAEAITTALELARTNPDTPALALVRDTALEALETGDRRRIQPRLFQRAQLLLAPAVVAAGALCLAPLPPLPPAPPPAQGRELVKIENLAGLERIEALEKLGGSSPEERERLKRIAEAARRLRADLEKGIERREALSSIAKLRDDIAAERMKFGDARNRAALDAAVAELERKKLLEKAARALGEGDLTAFDEEMQRIANLAESADREAAKEALEEAAKAAKEKGSQALNRALERELAKLREAEAKAEALRELARALGNGLSGAGRDALQEYGETGSPEAQRKLAEALERALDGLSEEERQRLAENLKRRADRGAGRLQPMTRAELEELAKKLSEKDADRRLEEQLRELARRDPSEDARRERGLGDADRGGAEAERGLGALPVPGQPGAGANGKSPGAEGPKSDPVEQKGSGGPGGDKDEGRGEHDGETAPQDTKGLRSKVDARLLPGGAMHGTTLGRTPGRAGETANQRGEGALGSVGRTEMGAVEGTDIPEEYREQVGRYFEP